MPCERGLVADHAEPVLRTYRPLGVATATRMPPQGIAVYSLLHRPRNSLRRRADPCMWTLSTSGRARRQEPFNVR